MNNQGVNLTISGLKCDNPNCNYSDSSIKMEDYESWVGEPCPECKEVLLTEADFNTVQNMVAATEVMQKLFPNRNKSTSESSVLKMEFELDGTGDVKIKK